MKLFSMRKHAVLSLIFMVTLMILLASIKTVHATDVLFIKQHLAISTFRDPTNNYDGYTRGSNILYHLHLNVTDSVTHAPLMISNLTMTDILPAGLTYVAGSQTSSSEGGSAPVFTAVGNKLLWNFSSLGNLTNPVLPPDGGSDKYTATAEFNATIDSNVGDSIYLVNNGQANYYEALVGPPSESTPATTDTIYVAYPILDIIKSNPSKIENGSSFNYVLTLNNTGELDATGINVTDTLPSGVIHTPGTSTATSGTFAVDNGTHVIWTGTIGNVTGPGPHIVNITIPVTASTATSSVFNIANYTAYPSYAQFTHSSANCTTGVVHPAITLTKTPSATKVENGSLVTYTYNVTNTGDISLTVSLTDNTFPSPIFTGKVLAPGASNITMVSHVLTVSTTNIATATGVDQLGASVSADATATVQVVHPAISLTKTPSATKVASGSSVTYTYNVTNTGDISLTVSLTDNTFPSPIFTGKTLAPGESNITMVSHVLTVTTTNIATATGVDQNGTSVNAQATATVQVVHPAISLTKTPSATKVENGSSVTYTYNVTNTGDISLTVSLTDNTFPSPIFAGKTLAPGESNITTVSHVLIANTTNIATATGVDQNGTSVNAQATAFVQVIHPAISLTKTADPSTPQIAPANFTYTYVVTNIGDVSLSNVRIYDQTFNQLILGPVTLSVGQSATGTWGPVTYPNVTASYTNYANATGVDQNGTSVEAFAQATVWLYVPPPTGGYLWSVNGVMVLFAAIEDTLVSNYWVAVLAVGAIAALIVFKRRRK